jgi:hypothetical protein
MMPHMNPGVTLLASMRQRTLVSRQGDVKTTKKGTAFAIPFDEERWVRDEARSAIGAVPYSALGLRSVS